MYPNGYALRLCECTMSAGLQVEGTVRYRQSLARLIQFLSLRCVAHPRTQSELDLFTLLMKCHAPS